MKKLKMIPLIVCLAMIMTFFAACGSKTTTDSGETASPEVSTDTTEPAETTGTAEENEDSSDTHIIVDSFGDEVEVVKNATKFVIPFPAACQCMLGLGAGENIIAGNIQGSDVNKLIFADLLESVTVAQNPLNIEEVMLMEPDVLVLNSTPENRGDDILNCGIPVLGYQGANMEQLMTSVNMLAEALGGEYVDKAADYCSFWEDLYNEVTALTDAIPEEEKPVVFLSVAPEGNCTSIGTLADTWVSASGGILASYLLDLDTDFSFAIDVTPEAIIELDPDIVVCTTTDAYAVFTEDAAYSSLKAVQNGEVYLMPMGGSIWWNAHFEAPLALAWAPTIFAPDYCESIDTRAIVTEFYQTFYNVEMTDELYDTICNPSYGAAAR